MLAGDFDGSPGVSSLSPNVDVQSQSIVAGTGRLFDSSTLSPEGEAANDLVAFAKALRDAGVTFFAAAWCPFCTQQRQLFEDGGEFLPFVEVTNPDRTLNDIGIAEGIQTFPTWDFADGTRVTGILTLTELSQLSGIAIPQGETPSFAPIGDLTVEIGSPLHIPIDAYDPDDASLTVTVSAADPSLLEGAVLQNNRSARISVQDWGDMVFELFDDRVPRPVGRFTELADAGFYDQTASGQIIFHRVIDDFVLQAGDRTGTGSGGSNLGAFDDQYHPDLQHNRTGVLSYAKSLDDTNDSQFFITEGQQRHLDYNHSVFGQLVEGDRVREAISETALSNSRPTTDVVISQIEIFEDTENSVVMLEATGANLGQTDVTVTVTDGDGNRFSEVITVTIIADQVNARPYLQDIAPVTTPAGVPAEFTLQGVDVEGDPIVYEARVIDSSGATASVNQSTGEVTVTSASGFSGAIMVEVAARSTDTPTSFNPSTRSSTMDLQVVTVDVGPMAPAGVALLANSDSGISSSDGITGFATLQFQVTDVQPGATVEVFADNVQIGVSTATDTTVTIVTSDLAVFGNGTYVVTARQTVGGISSLSSPSISVTYDTEPPLEVQSIPTQATVGAAYLANLQSREEGMGLRYTLVSGPNGMVVDAESGVLTWTPLETQTGDQEILVRLTDAAGNSSQQSFTLNVGADPVVGIRLAVADLNGTALSNLVVEQEFLLQVFADDLRIGTDANGVFSLYTDLLFDSGLVEVVGTNTFAYSNPYNLGVSGIVGDGIIDEAGAFSSSSAFLDGEERLIFSVRMRALSTSSSFIVSSDPADGTEAAVLVYNQDETVPSNRVSYGSLAVEINEAARIITTVTDSIDPAIPGGSLTYTIVLQNAGGRDAEDVIATTILPASVSLVNATAPAGAGTSVGNVLTLPFGTIRAGETQSATVTVQIDGTARGTLASNVSVTGTGLNGGVLSDTELTALAPQYDVTLNQFAVPTLALPGSSVQFTIQVTNVASSVSTAVGVIAEHVLPNGLMFSSASLNGLSLGSLSDIAVPNLEPGESATLVINATVSNNSTAGQVLTSIANIIAAPNETNVLTNTASANVTVDDVASVRGFLYWFKVDENDNLLPGVVFEVTQTHEYNFVSGLMIDIPDRVTTVVDNLAPDSAGEFGVFELNDLPLGRYSIREELALPGYDIDNQVRVYDLTPSLRTNIEPCSPFHLNVAQGDFFHHHCFPVWVNTISKRFLVGSLVAAREEYLLEIAQADVVAQNLFSDGEGAVAEGEITRARFTVTDVDGLVTLVQDSSGIGMAFGDASATPFVTTTELSEDVLVEVIPGLSGELFLNTGDGDDVIRVLTNNGLRIDGGAGSDRLVLDATGRFDLTNRSTQIRGIEEIDLGSGASRQTIVVDAVSVSTLGEASTPIIRIQSAQQVDLQGVWQVGSRLVEGGIVTQLFVSGQQSLRVISQNPWQNIGNRFDVNGDGISSALDALAVINRITRGSIAHLDQASLLDSQTGSLYDVNGDRLLSPLDALAVINSLNRESQLQGEAQAFAVPRQEGDINAVWNGSLHAPVRSDAEPHGLRIVFIGQSVNADFNPLGHSQQVNGSSESANWWYGPDLEDVVELLAMERSGLESVLLAD